ncbi:hypothetical protein BKA56DRAFT_732730 [Ilyonectria sp. MPI-CAGE-AT-0026]|nr:hypothetical protein BKA56DRAFT_732730 [Ilyonectria sp. MPI-CAGE-AT-0026]
MNSGNSATSSSSSVSTTGSVMEQVLRKAYKDPAKLRQGLDQLWGQGTYTIRLRNNRYIISGPRILTHDELEQLEEFAHQHYDSV